jgi:hypothetical protein
MTGIGGSEVKLSYWASIAETIQAMSQQSFDSLAFFVENADLRAAWMADEQGVATEEQLMQIRSYWAARLRAQQNKFLQIKLGILDEETALQIRDAGESGDGGRARSFKRNWAVMRRNYPADFVDYVDNVVISAESTIPE